MILVVAFCSKDADLQRRNLAWALELDAGCGREGVMSYDAMTPKADVEAIEKLATQYFTKVHHCRYNEPPVPGWPAACNWAWQSTARWMFEANLKQPWLWLEADAMPLKSGWFLTLEAAMTAGGKSFAGHVVKDMGHMNGVGIYPWDVMRRNEIAMLARAAAWDVVLKASTADDCTNLNHLIQHAWNIHPIDRKMIWNGEGTPLSFRSQADVEVYLDFNAVLLHRIKDGSLIPLLLERVMKEREVQRLITSTEYNVPQHTTANEHKRSIQPRGSQPEDSPNADEANPIKAPLVDGRTETQAAPKTHILIVTYWKDRPWLEYCLKALKKFCTGFTGITIAIPRKDFAAFASLKHDYGVTLQIYDEVRGRGMIQHMQKMAEADLLVPEGTDFVCHLDADCIYHTPTTPADYFTDGKPDYLIRSWESLRDPQSKVVSDCAQWFEPTEKQLGFAPEQYTMCRHPSIFPVGFYKPYRDWIAWVHGVSFEQYMLAGKNDFPQTRMDWTAMGAFAYANHREQFHWIDIGAQGAVVPKDRQRTFWSHGGTEVVKPELEAIVA